MREIQLPWPRAGDELLSSEDDHWTTAHVFESARTWYDYAYSYRRAAEVIFDQVGQPSGDPDSLVYPFVFLWRQYLELMMKSLIRVASTLLGDSRDVPLHHRLDKLWVVLRPLLESIEPGSASDLHAAEGTILRFAALDPTSMAFRYPRDKDGRPSFPPSIERINLANLHAVLTGVAHLFDGCYDGIDYYQRCLPDSSDYSV